MKKATKSKATKKVKTGSEDTGIPMMDMMMSKGIKKIKPKAGMTKKKYWYAAEKRVQSEDYQQKYPHWGTQR